MSTWHPSRLSPGLLSVITKIGKSRALDDFYLAGGTGLALRLGHRVSVDLDFFSAKNKLGFSDRVRIVEDLSGIGDFHTEEEKDGTLHGLLCHAELSLFFYSIPLLKACDSFRGLAIAGLQDIGLMKLAALVGRGSRKDFLDLYFLGQVLPLKRLLELAKKKFKGHRDFGVQAMKALVYFDDAQKEPWPVMRKKVAWADLESWFKKETRALVDLD